ncbi:hypothetical protein Tco_1482829 [Tanacetum coccineum]
MANTILNHLENAEKYLLTSTKFWPSLSTAAMLVALLSFYTTQQYTNTFTSFGLYIFALIIALHLILFFSNPQNIKNKMTLYLSGSVMKLALRVTAMTVAYMLHYVPEQTLVGLFFVICLWVDVVAIARIIKPESDLWVVNSVFMVVVSRSNDLYGFSARYWLSMLVCFPLIYLEIRLQGYKNEETKEKEG